MVEGPHFGDHFKNTLHGLGDNILGRTLWEFSKVFRVEQRGQEYIPQLQEHLQKGALIVPFTHPSVIDPMLVIHLMMEHFDLETRRFLMLTGKKFFDGRMGPHALPLINFMRKRFGIEFVPIIQSNDNFYSDEERFEFNTHQLKDLRNILICKPGGLLVALAPQGTRSPEMRRGQKGFDFLTSFANKELWNKQFKKNELVLFSALRNNGRISLTDLSRTTKIPVSTLYDKMRMYSSNIIKKYTVLLDFSKLGYAVRVHFFLKAEKRKKDALFSHLVNNINGITNDE